MVAGSGIEPLTSGLRVYRHEPCSPTLEQLLL